jgi:YVTN family beta-propeller protein
MRVFRLMFVMFVTLLLSGWSPRRILAAPTAPQRSPSAAGDSRSNRPSNAVGPLLFVTNIGTQYDQVAIIDTGNNTVAGYAPSLGSNAGPEHFTDGVTVTPDGSQAWAAAVAGQQVVVIDCKTLSVGASIPVTGRPRHVAFSPDGSKAYVVTEAGTVAIVNTANYSVITTLDISSSMPLYTQDPPYYMAAVFSLDGGTPYLLDVKGTVTVLNTQTNRVSARLTPGVPGSHAYQWIALSPDGTRYFITDSLLQELLVLDARTNQVIATVNVGGVPRGIVISPDGATAYIANQSGYVQFVDLRTYAITRTIAVGRNGARGIMVTADGSTIYATEAQGVAVISTASNTVVQTIAMDGGSAVQLGLQLPPPPVSLAAQTPAAAAQVIEEPTAPATESPDSLRGQAEKGYAAAQYKLGLLYAEGQGVPKDDAEALRWFRKAADQGNRGAQCFLGNWYAIGQGVPQDYAEALRWLLRSAEQGYSSAQFILGDMYDRGRGVPQDQVEAARWFRKAAEQGDAPSQINLGHMYQQGRGVPQDPSEAVRWYRRAAEQGFAPGEFNLGEMYFQGQGVKRDYAEALRWLLRAAEQGRSGAQLRLGDMYDRGRGVPRDYVEAVRWFRKAAEQGDDQGQWCLGVMYHQGLGVPRDYVEAHMWLNLAASSVTGDQQKKYAKRRDELARVMDFSQLMEAQRRAREWKPKIIENPGGGPYRYAFPRD